MSTLHLGRQTRLRPAGPVSDAQYQGLADCRCSAFACVHARVQCDPTLPRVTAVRRVTRTGGRS